MLPFMDGVGEGQASMLAIAVALGAARVAGWSDAEAALTAGLRPAAASAIRRVKEQIDAGNDPLGDWFCRLRSPQERRPQGATYTPDAIVRAMLGWAKGRAVPSRVVDPGAGSGRFIVSAGRTFPQAKLVAVELDPVAAVLCRAHVAAAGLRNRAEVLVCDYRALNLPELPSGERTLFLGNPPYVRHHLIDPQWKTWLMNEGRRRGLHPSSLAGLHVHFFLATAKMARPGDFACFVTSAEWLDVNYGRMVRELLLNGLGGERLVVIEPTAEPFPDAQTTAAIACLQAGAKPKSIFVQRVANVDELGNLAGGRRVCRERFEEESRWSRLTRRGKKTPTGFVELGELCRVHRGQVTGANNVWIAGEHSRHLPGSVLFATVTRAQELFAAGRQLVDATRLRRVIDLPDELDGFDAAQRRAIDAFLETARSMGAHEGYIAKHRRPWWSVGLRQPAPVLATYMARRPPAFVLNHAGARHLNIAHGLYPRDRMDDNMLLKLVDYLAKNVSLVNGRTYAGGLTKFEPREMERLLVPEPAALESGVFA